MVTEASPKFRTRTVIRHVPRAAAAGLSLLLAACNFTGVEVSSDVNSAPVPNVKSQPIAAGAAVGEVIGTGPVRVGAILPLTQNGAPSVIGQSLRNAAQLAVDESG